jgi:transposase
MQNHPQRSLIEHFKILPDPRVNRTKAHELIDVLSIGICTLLCAGESFNDMEDFGKAKADWFKTFLTLRNGIPSHDTFTGENVQLAYVDQGYTGETPAAAATEHGIKLEVVKHTEAKRGFVLLPRRWVVERSFAWAARFRRLARDYERLASTLAGYHWLAFALLMLQSLFAKSA